jgi:hypothetical protein
MTVLVPFKGGLTPRPYDVERLIERWQEGRSPHTVRAYGRDLAHFARWSEAAAPGEAITRLLTGSMGEANERLHAYRGAMLDAGLAPATVNRRLSALRSIVQLGRTFGLVTWSLEMTASRPRPTGIRRGLAGRGDCRQAPGCQASLASKGSARRGHRPRTIRLGIAARRVAALDLAISTSGQSALDQGQGTPRARSDYASAAHACRPEGVAKAPRQGAGPAVH